MKKTLIAVAAAAALATSSAFAEVTFGAWLRVLAAPVASDGDEIRTGMTNSWGYGARSARIDINGVSEDGKVGFGMGVFNDVGGIGMGDRASMWVRPIDQIKLSIGKFDSPDNGMRGDFTYGSWNWLRPYNWSFDGEGLTFDGIWRKGLMVEIDPIEALHIFAIVPLTTDFSDTAENTYKNIQAGFGYTIDGIGRIKAQYVGDYAEGVDGDKLGQVGVAFDLTAVENLYVTIGGRFGIADADSFSDYLKVAVTAGVSYQVMDALKISVDGGFRMYQDKAVGKADDPSDMEFFVGGGIDYAIADGLAAVADVRFKNVGYGKDGGDGAVSFLVGLNKAIGSNGSLGVGFQGATNGCGFSKTLNANAGDDFVWVIPISIGVWL